MGYDKRQLITLLRHLGYTQAADQGERELPDPVSSEQVVEFGKQHGISRDELVSRMGGSP